MLAFHVLLTKTREAHGLSVPELAQISGFDGSSIYGYEIGYGNFRKNKKGTKPPNGEDLKALCKAMGATPVETQQLLQAAFDFHKKLVLDRYQSCDVKWWHE
jgi:transcriptional regulator with XRE-family HTH domain